MFSVEPRCVWSVSPAHWRDASSGLRRRLVPSKQDSILVTSEDYTLSTTSTRPHWLFLPARQIQQQGRFTGKPDRIMSERYFSYCVHCPILILAVRKYMINIIKLICGRREKGVILRQMWKTRDFQLLFLFQYDSWMFKALLMRRFGLSWNYLDYLDYFREEIVLTRMWTRGFQTCLFQRDFWIIKVLIYRFRLSRNDLHYFEEKIKLVTQARWAAHKVHSIDSPLQRVSFVNDVLEWLSWAVSSPSAAKLSTSSVCPKSFLPRI